MMKKQQGFTLIELVAVIVILGALAVVALPRFINLQDEAEQAAAEGVAGAVSAAFATNYAASLVKDSSVAMTSGTKPTADQFVDVDDASEITGDNIDNVLMNGSPFDSGDYSVTNCGSFTPTAGEEITCDITKTDVTFDETVSFTAIATSG